MRAEGAMTTATEAPGGEPRTISAVGATVEVAGLRHRFGELDVIDRLDLTASAGEVVGVVGPSGCGKSTLLELIAGLLDPERGTLSVSGGSDASDRLPGSAFTSPRGPPPPRLAAPRHPAPRPPPPPRPRPPARPPP